MLAGRSPFNFQEMTRLLSLHTCAALIMTSVGAAIPGHSYHLYFSLNFSNKLLLYNHRHFCLVRGSRSSPEMSLQLRRGRLALHGRHGTPTHLKLLYERPRRALVWTCSTAPSDHTNSTPQIEEGPSTDIAVIFNRLQELATPYWTESPQASSARWRLASVLGLTLATTGVSVLFNYLGRDFFNAISAKDQVKFTEMLFKWLGALALGIPVFVLRDYYQSILALEWRKWMTEDLTKKYLEDRAFYRIQADALFDNPDQRIAVDVRNFTDTTLAFGVTVLNAVVDLVSFSEILYSIYPPLFAALLIYSVGGTAASIAIGKPLVGLNFAQEAQEANFRYGLVRVRENAESVAFYGGEEAEGSLLEGRLQGVVKNFRSLLGASRNLNFFTSFYRFLIQILPAAVIAPLFFRGEIEFGVINQSASAFNHILSDVSLVVYQFEAIAGFSAVIDRLGEFTEVLKDNIKEGPENVSVHNNGTIPNLLSIASLTLTVPTTGSPLIRDLSIEVQPNQPLLIMGPSGAGKTSLLRSIAGLWRSGSGRIDLQGQPIGKLEGQGDIFFIPQRPYMVLGSLRDQLLYPTWQHSSNTLDTSPDGNGIASSSDGSTPAGSIIAGKPRPTDRELKEALEKVKMTPLLERVNGNLDSEADWAGILSLGEQQRLAFARVLLAVPKLALLDEATSALDTTNEEILYKALASSSVTCVSVGHRPTLLKYHQKVLLLDGGGGWEVKNSSAVSLETAVNMMD